MVEARVEVSEIGVTFDPTTEQSKVSAEEALQTAWGTGVPGSPTSATAAYGALTEARYVGYKGSPAWLITYSGACVPNFGPANDDRSECLGSKWNVIVDAETGDVVVTYSVQ
jgi:transcription elongation factor